MKRYGIVAVGIVAVGFVIGIRFKPRQEVTEPLADPVEAAKPAAPSDVTAEQFRGELPTTNSVPRDKTVLQRIADNDASVFKLSPEQVAAFLAKNGTNVESLVAAFNVTSDKELLREAARRFPENAFVLATVLANDVLPDQRRELIERLKEVSPENALANYLSARDYLKNQQADLALREFTEGSSKNGFQDFSVERIQGLEEIYLSASYSAAEAKALAMTSLKVPSVAELRELGREMSKLEGQYAAAGDAASAEMVARLGLSLAADITRGNANSLLSQIVGTVVEREFLSGLDPNASYDFLAQPVSERLAQLQAQNRSIREAAKFFDHWMQRANDAQLVSYFDRLKLYGEAAAIDWARNQLLEVAPAGEGNDR
jgi:hypothetical protein